jgi:peptide chain release factor 1
MFDKLAGIEQRFIALEREMAEAAQDYQKVAELARERSEIEPIVQAYRAYHSVSDQLEQSRALRDGDDAEMRELAEQDLADLEPQLEQLAEELKSMLVPKDPRDSKNVIVEIRAGTGGDEAGLFAADLYRMYSRYAEARKWSVDVLSQNETGVGGFKEIIFEVKGKGAFSRLKFESGVHRVQRVPVTESQGRIHTSTATVAVMAEADEVEIKIPEKDIKVEVFRAGGAGGQSVQKNETAVRITHVPTGIVAQCQDERSQLQNKVRAMNILRARIYEMELAKKQAEEDATRKQLVGTGGRSEKIRTYNFPQSRVTDHRIGLTTHNLQEILDGNLDRFLEELSTKDAAERLQAESS